MTALQQYAKDLGIIIPDTYFELEKKQIIAAFDTGNSENDFFIPIDNPGENYYNTTYPTT